MSTKLGTKESELLTSVFEISEMGCKSIEQLMPRINDEKLKSVINRQLFEYQSVNNISKNMLENMGIKPDGISKSSQILSGMMSIIKTLSDSSSTKIAELMIKGTTDGIMELTKTIRKIPDAEKNSQNLAEKLLKIQQHNINELKCFL